MDIAIYAYGVKNMKDKTARKRKSETDAFATVSQVYRIKAP